MPRTQWVLNWPGQVTIAGCQTYWTMEVGEALEVSNLSSQLFPQLSKQVRAKSVPAPHTPGEPSPKGTFSDIESARGQGLGPKSRSDTPEMDVLQ
jgi:hypothetical protein